MSTVVSNTKFNFFYLYFCVYTYVKDNEKGRTACWKSLSRWPEDQLKTEVDILCDSKLTQYWVSKDNIILRAQYSFVCLQSPTRYKLYI